MVVTGLCGVFFCRAGRWAPSVAFLPFTALYAYANGLFTCAIWLCVLRALCLFLACMLPIAIPDKHFVNTKKKLLVQPLLPARATELMRERTGERLFRISDVFREMELAFSSMDEGVNEAGAKARVFAEMKERNCKICERRELCEKSNVYSGFLKLVNTGCVKGKVSVIDLPSEVTVACAHPAELIARLNQSLAEYRRFMTASDNARAGRMLLAEQARGIEGVMKSLALELCRLPNDNAPLCDALLKALAKQGIACSEVEIEGESNLQITLVVGGDPPQSKLNKAICEVCRKSFLLKEKIPYDSQKMCFVYVVPPRFDAAFGMAFAIKKGESISGDTHSVIRINEHQFLATLSDGMGSGAYAQKISATAISLVEAFYRAQMPRGAVLDTINKLLSYRRDERFTCLDIAAVDLNTGDAEFVKIGAPFSIILRGKECIVLESEGLPLGILESVKPSVLHETLQNGDMLLFMSDGVTSAYHSAADLCEFLQSLSPLNPQNLADTILQEGLRRTQGTAEDDMTVLCVRLFESKE
jgi:stage II sporulation protein E